MARRQQRRNSNHYERRPEERGILHRGICEWQRTYVHIAKNAPSAQLNQSLIIERLDSEGRSIPGLKSIPKILQCNLSPTSRGTVLSQHEKFSDSDLLSGPRVVVALAHTQAVALPRRAVQRIVFPLVVFVGCVLGKYRGASWPGSPESRAGAPGTQGAGD